MKQLSQWISELRTCWSATATVPDFLRLLRARLARSKVGPLVCPRPTVIPVRVPELGGTVWLRSHSTDYGVLFEVLGRAYQALEGYDANARTIVDLGANNGLVARWLLTRYPDARIVCVEPEPGNVEMLRRNLAEYNGRAAIVPACVGATERTVSLSTTQGDWGWSMSDAPGEIEAPVVTMDHLVDEHSLDRIDVLKCDIEGAEREVFEHCESWIDRVGFAVVECHGMKGEDVLPRGWHVTDRHGWWDEYGVETVAIAPARENHVAAH